MSKTEKSFGPAETRAFAVAGADPRVLATIEIRAASGDPGAYFASSSAHMTPAQAREFAAALAAAADFAEGKDGAK